MRWIALHLHRPTGRLIHGHQHPARIRAVMRTDRMHNLHPVQTRTRFYGGGSHTLILVQLHVLARIIAVVCFCQDERHPVSNPHGSFHRHPSPPRSLLRRSHRRHHHHHGARAQGPPPGRPRRPSCRSPHLVPLFHFLRFCRHLLDKPSPPRPPHRRGRR